MGGTRAGEYGGVSAKLCSCLDFGMHPDDPHPHCHPHCHPHHHPHCHSHCRPRCHPHCHPHPHHPHHPHYLPSQEEERSTAALRIQASFRGFKARKELEQQKGPEVEGAAEGEEEEVVDELERMRRELAKERERMQQVRELHTQGRKVHETVRLRACFLL